MNAIARDIKPDAETSTWTVYFGRRTFTGFQSQQVAERFALRLWNDSHLYFIDHENDDEIRAWMEKDDRESLQEASVAEGYGSMSWCIASEDGEDSIYFDFYDLPDWTGGRYVAVQSAIDCNTGSYCEDRDADIVLRENVLMWLTAEIDSAIYWFVENGYSVDEVGEDGESIRSQAAEVKAELAESLKSSSKP